MKPMVIWFMSVNMVLAFLWSASAQAETAFKINGKTYSVKKLYADDRSAFYELEKQKYELIARMAEQKFLDAFWEKLAKKNKTTADKARDDYMAKNAKVSDSEVKKTLEKFKDHPQLKKMSKAEQEKNVRSYLETTAMQEVVGDIIASAKAKKELVVAYPKPKEPTFKLKITKNDPVRYGPNPADTKPMGCKGDACKITVVEYSEFQCPFCTRVIPTVKRLMTEYKGKVRWIVRDFPLSFHDRARPAGIAARCAMNQGKYWEMYLKLFENQRALGDGDFKRYAKAIGLDTKKFEKCYANPGEIEKIIDENFATGQKFGVTGTPAFFVNGRRLSGALPYENFKEIFEDELSTKGKS